MDGMQGDWAEQSSGIRQGCTIPPFLFIVILSVVMHDVTRMATACRPLLLAPPSTSLTLNMPTTLSL
eukprot:13334017-Alexandrium_andersonii.AAC.1